ncbi:UDP-N-acetylmuramoylalanyl-D-glutamyl-2,6-diaminopimelate--D-alanyl-D-alanine ligase [Sneathiella sp. P13V-1]|uniref:UDP-N-acetylmuramoylalanyl-D-glutamyl-2, 6-diaminopimelate--D-alanyl-D-alanine ligase n=1 Tax=Sneathiella sp. P13V-1 TaxID=2697366 RepID=UPI00187B137D|nr:UDP-N-acetylmuramoylalanyl-D-glutamyl-2,6-diaminopimelate--D-alanyl-D-alanine ligase [Sneathiella sp. P13V-1]MBE7636681.1 UDP-N-acetylmuramoylalanyl-D-glutamyl-2,6-diaminopimelate--D-alanyl-D-alanine ligase [Sneathiella sp. P13V-1]
MTSPLWTAENIIAATAGECAETDWTVNGIVIDNRAVSPGDLFIAIVGPNNDGHNYVEAAMEAGAVAAIVSKPVQAVADKIPLVMVEDTQVAMEALGKASRSRSNAKIIAVTGSVGKTGTKEALAHVLSAQGKTHWSVGSFNNHWGVPLSLSRMPIDAEYAIFELGMNHAGELTPLSQMVKPHVAIVTTVAAAHMEFFESVEDIARAKAEIFNGLQSSGVAIINADIPYTDLLVAEAKKVSGADVQLFGENTSAQIHLDDVTVNPQSSEVSATIDGHKADFTLPVPGRHWVQNILAVLGAVKAVGADVDKAIETLKTLNAPSGRGVQIELETVGGSYRLIDESYNASPIAMQAAFEVLGNLEIKGQGRRIAVLGDMRELGEDAPEIHRSLANDLLENGVDMVYACGPHMRELYEALPQKMKAAYAASSDELVESVLGAVRCDDAVLIKGSLGSRMKVILDALLDQSKGLGMASGSEE